MHVKTTSTRYSFDLFNHSGRTQIARFHSEMTPPDGFGVANLRRAVEFAAHEPKGFGILMQDVFCGQEESGFCPPKLIAMGDVDACRRGAWGMPESDRFFVLQVFPDSFPNEWLLKVVPHHNVPEQEIQAVLCRLNEDSTS